MDRDIWEMVLDESREYDWKEYEEQRPAAQERQAEERQAEERRERQAERQAAQEERQAQDMCIDKWEDCTAAYVQGYVLRHVY